jgi:hypothetical protein
MRLNDVNNGTGKMCTVKWRHATHYRNEWRRATWEALILPAQCSKINRRRINDSYN